MTHPDWDDQLWLGDTDPRDWLGQPPPGPMTLNELERTTAYRAIKRRFFFEHRAGIDLLSLVPADEQEFQETLRAGASAGATVVRDLVLALNRFFEPDCPDSDRDRVQLWQSHRYDVRAPSTFVSFHALSYQHLRIEPLKVAPWVEAWLPEEQVDRRSFALVATWEGEDIAVVEIDRELFLTLIEAERGLGPIELVAHGDPAHHPLHRPDPRSGGTRVADRGHPCPQRRERPRRAVRDPAGTGEVPVVNPDGHEGAAGSPSTTRSSGSGSPTSRSSRSTSPTASPGHSPAERTTPRR